MKISEFKNKKIAILGCGIEGISVASFLLRNNFSFAILDRNQNATLPKGANSNSITGSEYLSNLSDFDLIIRSPGIKPDLSELVEFHKKGGVIETQTRIFFDNYPCPEKIIGVTGTKGKGTTCMLIKSALEKGGFKAMIGGNIGKGMMELLDTALPDSWVVLELSSFQLQDLQNSPHIAVVLMVTSDHLDYHSNVEEYVQAKSAITSFQNKSDFAIVNADYPSSLQIGNSGNGVKVFFSSSGSNLLSNAEFGALASKEDDEMYFLRGGKRSVVGKVSDLKLRGFHNAQNVCAAALVASLCGVSDDKIWEACSEFSGFSHRLQLVIEKNGIKFYDDSAGTNTASVLTAVDAFSEPVLLISGGFDKGQDYQEMGVRLAEKAPEDLKAVILLGNIGLKIAEGLKSGGYKGTIIHFTEPSRKAYDQAIEKIKSLANSGDVVLLAPGTSSFDMFKDYKERGEYFSSLVEKF